MREICMRNPSIFDNVWQVLAVAAVGLTDFRALVASMEKLLRSSNLLQAAVLSGSLSMVIMLLDLHERFG